MVRISVASGGIRSVSLWRKRASLFGLGVGIEHYLFLVLYALAVQQCVLTIGQPYAAAAAHAAARKAAVASATAAVLQSAGGDAATVAAAAALAKPPAVEEPDPWAEAAAAAAPAPAGAWANDAVKFGAADGEEDETPLPHKLLPAFWAMVLTVRAAAISRARAATDAPPCFAQPREHRRLCFCCTCCLSWRSTGPFACAWRCAAAPRRRWRLARFSW
jgi:hypothetical protein